MLPLATTLSLVQSSPIETKHLTFSQPAAILRLELLESPPQQGFPSELALNKTKVENRHLNIFILIPITHLDNLSRECR